jgi:hypothetical protein
VESVFGHLALRFGSSPENLATEALHFILTRSKEAHELFTRILSGFGLSFQKPLLFQTQVADEKGAIPDLVAFEGGEIERVIIEAKFWAGLTPRQPNSYLDRLPPGDGLVLFLAPSRRIPLLWPELLRRCREKLPEPIREDCPSGDTVCAFLSDGRRMGVISWRSVLESFALGITSSGNPNAASDLLQLRGLTERMDSELFIPFTGEELTSNLGTRILQLCQIMDRVVELLATKQIARTKERNTSARWPGYYGQLFRTAEAGCRLYFSPDRWSATGHPLGIDFLDTNKFESSPSINQRLAPLLLEFPGRFRIDEWGSHLSLEIRRGVEIDVVVQHIFEQIESVLQRLRNQPITNGDPAPSRSPPS